MVLCAAELPLENLCKVKDTFVVPGNITVESDLKATFIWQISVYYEKKV